jgi:phenylalanyl-tRNA synthetase alpha subunit
LSSVISHISIIHTKLQQLLKQHELLKKDKVKYEQQLASLQQEQLQQKEKMEELLQQNLLLKASVTSMEGADKKALEQKIQHYVKNIDKCISLLSK